MTINVQSVIRFIRAFALTGTEKAELDVAATGDALWHKIDTMPELAAFEAAIEALAKAKGWGVSRDATTGHIAAVTPPYVAPAHQSPADFNAHQG